MNSTSCTLAFILAASSFALAQQAQPSNLVQLASLSASPDESAQEAERAAQAEIRAKKEIQEKIEVLAAHSKVVAGKPYSANSTTEVVQTLTDGNRIVQHSSSVFYRDSQGRTRREQTFPGFENSPGETKIFIDDPVAKNAYVLDPHEKIAHTVSSSREVMLKIERSNDTMANVKLPKLDEAHDITSDQLGTMNIQGVTCIGKRQTITIPAGQVGNERPIAIVTETWFSPDIDAVVQSTTTDPRFGQTTYTLKNLQLKEQPAALFALPNNYRLLN
ncbi:MAG: hypothetical protein JSS95_07300 [Acidobacteria bacterium]|nr:hypothetical protein [Acidobacteriota bacterium]